MVEKNIGVELSRNVFYKLNKYSEKISFYCNLLGVEGGSESPWYKIRCDFSAKISSFIANTSELLSSEYASLDLTSELDLEYKKLNSQIYLEWEEREFGEQYEFDDRGFFMNLVFLNNKKDVLHSDEDELSVFMTGEVLKNGE